MKRALDHFPDDETYPGIFIVRFDGGLYFVTTEVLSPNDVIGVIA